MKRHILENRNEYNYLVKKNLINPNDDYVINDEGVIIVNGVEVGVSSRSVVNGEQEEVNILSTNYTRLSNKSKYDEAERNILLDSGIQISEHTNGIDIDAKNYIEMSSPIISLANQGGSSNVNIVGNLNISGSLIKNGVSVLDYYKEGVNTEIVDDEVINHGYANFGLTDSITLYATANNVNIIIKDVDYVKNSKMPFTKFIKEILSIRLADAKKIIDDFCNQVITSYVYECLTTELSQAIVDSANNYDVNVLDYRPGFDINNNVHGITDFKLTVNNKKVVTEDEIQALRDEIDTLKQVIRGLGGNI